MSRVEALESEIKTLSPGEFWELRARLAEHNADVWDQRLQADALAGRLDAIAGQALKDFAEDRSTDF